MKKLISILLSTITLTACSSDTSSVALQRGNNGKNFENWCKEKSTLPEETQITIEILLKEAGTQDCRKANLKLDKLTYLSLTQLLLGQNQISDIKPLSNLTNLTRLTFQHNKITDIKPLSNLTNLTWLQLDTNRITDIKPLSNFLIINN